jgi:hypothetical protein
VFFTLLQDWAIFDALVLETGTCLSSVSGFDSLLFGAESDCGWLDFEAGIVSVFCRYLDPTTLPVV